MGDMEKDCLSQLVSEFVISADEQNFNVDDNLICFDDDDFDLDRPTGNPSVFVEPYDLMQDTPTPKEEEKAVIPSAQDEDELNSDECMFL